MNNTYSDVLHETLTCRYCQLEITAGDDAQRIAHGQYAHTACAWAADGAFWEVRDVLISREQGEAHDVR